MFSALWLVWISIGEAAESIYCRRDYFSPRSYLRMHRGVGVLFDECGSGYFLLRVKRMPAAPNPAKTPATGTGDDACDVGFTGDTTGCGSVGSAVGAAVGSAVAVKPDRCTVVAAG